MNLLSSITGKTVLAVLLAWAGGHVTSAFGQETAPDGDKSNVSSPAVELSPFVISSEKDRGYTPGSVTSGSRLALSLKDTSAMVGVLTKEFIDDIGANSFEQAANWGANVVMEGNENNAVNASFSPSAIVRGIPGSAWSASRNYFIAYVPIDTATVERIEIARGPNAALFGDAPLGGLINSNSKRAKLQQNFAEVTFKGDNFGSLRGSFDLNVSRGDNLAIRVNAADERDNGWKDNDISRNEVLLLSGTWRPEKNTTVRGEVQFNYQSRTSPSYTLTDGVNAYDGSVIGVTNLSLPAGAATSTANGLISVNPAATTGTTTFSTSGGADYWVLDSSNRQAGLQNWKGFLRTTGKGGVMLPSDLDNAAALRPDLPRYTALPSREFDFNPSGTPWSEKRTILAAAFIEHRFWDKLNLELGFQHVNPRVSRFQGVGFGTYMVDLNKVRPDGSANPHFGEAFGEQEYTRQIVKNWVDDYRVMASYPIKLGFMEQTFVVMAGRHRDQFLLDQGRLTRLNGANNTTQNANNIVRVRRYASDTSEDYAMPFDSNGLALGYRTYNLQKQDSLTKYAQVLASGRYWDGKVSTTLGVRRDLFTQDATDTAVNGVLTSASNVLVTQQQGILWRSQNPARIASPTTNDDYPQEFRKNSITAGAVYFPFKSIGLFVNKSQGFNVVGTGPHLDGSPWDPPSNVGYDYGLKIELFDGRISGTASRYQSTRVGVDNTFGNVTTNLRTTWGLIRDGYNNVGDTANATAAQASLDAIDSGAIADRTSKARGWELDLTANLTRNWRAILNFALPEVKISASAAEQKAYYSQNRANFIAKANAAGFDTTGINNQIAIMDTYFAVNADGRTATNVADYTARLWTTYRIPTGALRSLTFGGGVQVDGPRVVGVPQVYQAASATTGSFITPDPLGELKSQSTCIFALMANYEFKVWNRRLKVQLNIDNLFDQDKIVWTGYTTYTQIIGGVQKGYQVPGTYRYINPRQVSLTGTITF